MEHEAYVRAGLCAEVGSAFRRDKVMAGRGVLGVPGCAAVDGSAESAVQHGESSGSNRSDRPVIGAVAWGQFCGQGIRTVATVVTGRDLHPPNTQPLQPDSLHCASVSIEPCST